MNERKPTTKERILVVADSLAATQEISFARPLAPLAKRGDIALTLLADSAALRNKEECTAIWNQANPTVVFLSRFTFAHQTFLFGLAAAKRVPVIFHIDDNLFNVPASLGPEKFAIYNDPARLDSLRTSINQCAALYVSTQALGMSFSKMALKPAIFSGSIYCSAEASDISAPKEASAPTIGYMGTGGHSTDLAMIMPAIDRLMDEIPNLRFETFGTIKPPAESKKYGTRYVRHPAEPSYSSFIKKLPALGWWVGLAPLESNPFNMAKADTKWVEYTQSGIAVVTSKISVYSKASSGSCAMMALEPKAWHKEIKALVENPDQRRKLVKAAQDKLRTEYTPEKLRAQIFDVIALAKQKK